MDEMGKRIRALRLGKNISVKDFAAEVGISPTYVWYVENKGKGVRVETLNRISQALGVPIEELLGTNNTP